MQAESAQSKLNLSKPQAWAGEWTALITPWSQDSKIDEQSLEKCIENQIASGIHGLVIAGSTGEGSLMNAQELHTIWTLTRDIVKGRVPLVGGLGIGGTRSCLQNLETLIELGFQGGLASPPAYIKAPQRGLIEHYLALGQPGLPICIYEVAGRAASSITVDTLKILANSTDPAAQNLVAIKDASADMHRVQQERAQLGERFALLSGDDGSYLTFLASGGHGVISVATHVFAKEFAEIRNAFQKGQVNEARDIQLRLNHCIDLMFSESNPIPIKALMHKLGLIKNNTLQSPLQPMDPQKFEVLWGAYKKSRELS